MAVREIDFEEARKWASNQKNLVEVMGEFKSKSITAKQAKTLSTKEKKEVILTQHELNDYWLILMESTTSRPTLQ